MAEFRGAGEKLAVFVASEEARRVDWTDKAAGAALVGRSSASLTSSPVRMSALNTPMLTIEQPALSRNITVMQRWCDTQDVLLAPHGKTTMAPRIWRDQLAAGSWGITVATEAQLRLAVGSGVRRVHLANTLLSTGGLRWLVAQLGSDPGLTVQFWIDSVASVQVIDQALEDGPRDTVIPVLVEIGTAGGRTGTRSLDQTVEVATAISRSPHLALVGIAGYEGAVHAEPEIRLAAIDRYLSSLVEAHERIAPLYPDGEVFLSAGGSAYFDRVVVILGTAATTSTRTARVIVRSGAYVAHDDGFYARITPSTRDAGPEFVAALHGWARVISTPQPGLAILDAGRRDLPFDQGLPFAQQVRRPDPAGSFGQRRQLDATVTQLNDQHAFLDYSRAGDIRPGDVIRLGISHPCTAFDKWRTIPVIDDADADDPNVHALVHTYF